MSRRTIVACVASTRIAMSGIAKCVTSALRVLGWFVGAMEVARCMTMLVSAAEWQSYERTQHNILDVAKVSTST
jgi:hypothetical protein